ncbi:ComEC family competence protein [bacterium]|nr:ComEC family competence protein [bacterium]
MLSLFLRFNLKLRLIFLIGFFLFLGIWRFSVSVPVDSPDKIWHYNGRHIDFIGKVADEPRIEPTKQRIIINTFYSSNLDKELKGKVLVYSDLYPKINYGDNLNIKCELKAPEPFNGFSYDRYLAKSDIYSVCYYPEIERIEKNKYLSGNNFKFLFFSRVYSFKNKIRYLINMSVGEPEASVLRAMTLGDKWSVPDDVRENFAKSGLSHIMAISGMHIGIILTVIFSFLLFLGFFRSKAFYFSSIFLLFYITIIGFPASAVRASIMGFLVLLSFNLGRLNQIINSLALAACFMLIINPAFLRDDIGFQLSFLAVLGIIYFYPFLSEFLKKPFGGKEGKVIGAIINLISLTLSAQILTLPLIAWNFSQISIVALFSNLLVLWVIPFLFVSFILALVLSFLLPSLSFWFFLPTFLILKYILVVVNFFASSPIFYLEVEKINFAWISLYYFVIALCYMIFIRERRKNID